MKTTISAILGLAVLLGFWWGSSGVSVDENVLRVKLRDLVFHIPERYSTRGTAPFWLSWIRGLDSSSAEIGFKVSYEEVRAAIPPLKGKGHFHIFAVLTVLSDEELARYHSPSRLHREMWYDEGSYKGRRIEAFGETGWYRLYHPLEDPTSWSVFRQYPDPDTPVPDDPRSFFVARCGLRVGGKTTLCLTHALFDRIAVDFRTEEENLVLVDQIRDFMIAKVLEWKQSK